MSQPDGKKEISEHNPTEEKVVDYTKLVKSHVFKVFTIDAVCSRCRRDNNLPCKHPNDGMYYPRWK